MPKPPGRGVPLYMTYIYAIYQGGPRGGEPFRGVIFDPLLESSWRLLAVASRSELTALRCSSSLRRPLFCSFIDTFPTMVSRRPHRGSKKGQKNGQKRGRRRSPRRSPGGIRRRKKKCIYILDIYMHFSPPGFRALFSHFSTLGSGTTPRLGPLESAIITATARSLRISVESSNSKNYIRKIDTRQH